MGNQKQKLILSNHFVERWRERIAQTKTNKIKEYGREYIVWLVKELYKNTASCKMYDYTQIPETWNKIIHSKHKIKYSVFFEYMNHIYIGKYDKNKSNEPVILLLTCYKKSL